MRKIAIGRIAALVWMAMLAACARYGQGPTGGPADLLPPVLVKAQPAEGSTEFAQTAIRLGFDEFVVLQNTDKIIVSPLLTKISYETNLREVIVTISDTLLPDKTYTINFKDAIGDLHESTPLRNYTYVFSTGKTIDSGRIGGAVKDALTLSPVSEARVLLYAVKPETYPVTEAPDYVSVTDTAGIFQVPYIKEGCYYVLVCSDENQNYRIDPSEEKMAYSSTCWNTRKVYPEISFRKVPGQKESDTGTRRAYDQRWAEYRNREWADIERDGTILYMYQDRVDDVFLKEVKWNSPGELEIEWYYPLSLDSVGFMFIPSLSDIEMAAQFEAMKAADTVQDSKRKRGRNSDQEMEKPDLTWPDSLRFVILPTDEPLKSKIYFDNLGISDFRLCVDYRTFSDTAELMLQNTGRKDTAKFKILNTVSELFYRDSFPVKFSHPVDSTDWSTMRVWQYHQDEEGRQDTVEIVPAQIECRKVSPMEIAWYYDWKPGCRYSFFMPSACVKDWYGRMIDTSGISFSCPALESYGQLAVTLQGLDSASAYLLQLIGTDKKEIESKVVLQDGMVEFPMVRPGAVSFVLIKDDNRNGRWDPGYYQDGIQPERRWFFPKTLDVESDWRIEETWSIR